MGQDHVFGKFHFDFNSLFTHPQPPHLTVFVQVQATPDLQTSCRYPSRARNHSSGPSNCWYCTGPTKTTRERPSRAHRRLGARSDRPTTNHRRSSFPAMRTVVKSGSGAAVGIIVSCSSKPLAVALATCADFSVRLGNVCPGVFLSGEGHPKR